ncbi:MAG: nucleoside triphosphate pyrophosphatase [Planctomycetota bacterium]
MIIPALILASASPRRKQLLAEAGYKFKVVPSSVDEGTFACEGVAPAEHAKQLALAKAKDIAEKFPDCLVIGADTVVDYDGRIVGKPADAKDAERITRMLFSKPHKVITGVAIVCKSRRVEIVEADTTVVYPKPLTDAQIAGHIASGVWRDKAGAYAIQEQSDPFVDHIEGSLTNVMGLPLELLKRLLSHRDF